MALVYHDRIAEIVTTEGTGSFTLTGSVPTGYRAFTTLTATNTCYYHCNNQLTNEWEVGLGTYSAGILTRDTVTASSSFNNKVDFTTGNKTLSLVIPSVAVQGMIDALSTSGDTTLIWSEEVTGAAVSQVEATGLDINTHKGYKVVVGLVSAASSATSINLRINGDGLDIPGLQIASSGSTLDTVTITGLAISQASATSGQISFSICDMSLINGYVCANTNIMLYNTTEARIRWNKKSTTTTNVTSMQFIAASGTPIGIGSKFYIFKKSNQ